MYLCKIIHDFLREGSKTQLSQFAEITVLEPAESLIVYQSRLTVVIGAKKPPSYWLV